MLFFFLLLLTIQPLANFPLKSKNSALLSEAELCPTDAVCTSVKYDRKSKPTENIISKVGRNCT